MKKILTSILSVLILALSTPMVCFAAGVEASFTDSGYCGKIDEKELGWIYISDNSTLYLNSKGMSGSYEMKNFESEDDVPWKKYKKDIKRALISDVNNISDYAFANCPELTYVSIRDYNGYTKFIGRHSFENCTKLKSVTIPSGITQICDCAFKGCTQLETVKLPNTLVAIMASAFENCGSLTSIDLPDSLYSIGDRAFSKTGLKCLTLPYGYYGLSYNVFFGCKSLTTVDMSKWNGYDLCSSQFRNCSNLTTVYLPEHDTTLDETTFKNCRNIKKIYAYEGYDYEGIPQRLMPKVTVIKGGKTETYGNVIQYITPEGKTMVTVDKKDIIWLKEESDGTSAWYGLDNRNGDFDIGSEFYVHWLNEKEHPEAFENIDENIRKEVDNNNGWLFDVGVIDPEGNPYTTLNKDVKLYVQISDDWDIDDLDSYYIATGQDTNVPVTSETNVEYPVGLGNFGVMTLSHFSPYFIYDKLNDKEKAAFDALSDEEKAQLDAAAKELAAQQNEKTEEKSETKSEKNSSSSSPKTGDEITYFTISGLGLMMTLALGLMLNSKINRRKLDE